MSAVPDRTKARLRGVALVAVGVLASCLSGVAVASSPSGVITTRPAGTGAVEVSAAVAPAPGRWGIPPIPDPDPTTGNPVPYSGGIGSTVAEATKAKVDVTVPAFTIFSRTDFCVFIPGQSPNPGCPDVYPKSSADARGEVFWLSTEGAVWVVSDEIGRRATGKRFGALPSATVSTLAFGSIPVSATVHIVQAVGSDGYYEPLDFGYVVGSPFRPGDTVDGWGTAPKKPHKGFNSWTLVLPTLLTGRVDIRLSDVTVDEQPVDVGPDCTTATPATLSLGAPGGFVDTTLTATDLYGKPGEFDTTPGSTLQGTIDIPAFRGCRDGNGSLDALLTAMVSADGNPVQATVNQQINQCDKKTCPPYPRASSTRR